MIPREDLPEDAAEWISAAVSFDRLAQDSADSCPCSADEIFEYVQMESADVDRAERDPLELRRTAQVAEARFWLWQYTEADGETVFVTYRSNPNGSSCLGLASPNGLSAEQLMLAEYYDEVSWS